MKEIFGGAIATILLGIYVHLVRLAFVVVDCAETAGCTAYSVESFNDVMVQSLNVISGLVSALVIAELAITKPGEAPAGRVLATDASPFSKSMLKTVSVVYVLVWLITGLFAFMKGMYHPSTLAVLTGVGQAWLGLAVAAAYAYFGLHPTNPAMADPSA